MNKNAEYYDGEFINHATNCIFIYHTWITLISTLYDMLSHNSIKLTITILLRNMFLIPGRFYVKDLTSYKKLSIIHNLLIAQLPKVEDKNAGRKKNKLIGCNLMWFWFPPCVELFKLVRLCSEIGISRYLWNLFFQRHWDLLVISARILMKK